MRASKILAASFVSLLAGAASSACSPSHASPNDDAGAPIDGGDASITPT
jgi:hypothetical protein